MTTEVSEFAQVTRRGFLDMQVCVPRDWTDLSAENFAEHQNPCGTEGGWRVRKQGSEFLCGCDERVPCEQRPGFVHLMLDA